MDANLVNTGRGYLLAWILASTIGFGMGAVLGMSTAWRRASLVTAPITFQ